MPIQYSQFSKILEELDFSINTNYLSDSPDIIFLNDVPQNLHPKIYFYLEFAETLEADAVYFRYYDDNRYCIPQVYFYDNTINIRDKEEIAEIHKKVYSSCQVPAICVINKDKISLYDERIPVEIKDNKLSNSNSLFREVDKKDLHTLKAFFSAQSLNSGLFWESEEASSHFHNNKSAYEVLLKELIKIRTELNNLISIDLSDSFSDDLLFKCILAKYLEENAKEEEKNFAEEFYKKEGLQYLTLKENIENKNLHNLFECLENHFNGKVFFLSENERKILSNLDDDKFYHIAALLDGRIENQQISIWEIYSFKHIPIELISNFYEEFINEEEKKNSGTVYTPSFLVNFLIDECLPINSSTIDYNVKLIDVSCGSGIFISSAFKRLVQRYRVAKRGKDVILDKKKIKLNDVKQILIQNIFGVDKNKTAVKLTKFSLQLALCQAVPNNELWNWTDDKVKVFENLNQNISNEDFFDFLVQKQYSQYHNYFDWIIGNPPFTSLSSNDYEEYVEKLSPIYRFSVKIPDNQLALMFLEASNLLLKEKGDLCFIQKSTSLLYNKNSKEFKNSFFSNFHVYQVIDFTLLKNHLFKTSKRTDLISSSKNKSTSVESCAIFYKKNKVEDYDTTHIVSRLLKSTKDGLFFEFDYYDFFEITKNQAIKDQDIWRCNLLGGNRLHHLVENLKIENENQKLFTNYLIEDLKVSKNSYSEGFMRGTPKGETINKNFYCEYVINKQILEAKSFSKLKFTNYNQNQKFYYVPNEEAFLAPLVVIKEQVTKSKLLIEKLSQDTAYDSRIVGVSLNSDADAESLYDKLKANERVNTLKTIATCSQFFLGSSSVIQKADIDNWIVPLKNHEILLSDDEKIVLNDVLDYIYPSWYEGEKAVINESNATVQDLKNYSEILSDKYNVIYAKGNFCQKLNKIIEGDYFYALEFLYNAEKADQVNPIQSEEDLEDILINKVSRNKRINRILKIYGENTITFVKPKNLRYWLKSIALRDMDDILDDVISKSYK